jgi:hypothetical protein
MTEFLSKLANFILFLLLFFIFPPMGILFLIRRYACSESSTYISQSPFLEDTPGQISLKTNMAALCYIDPHGYFRFHDSNKLFHRWVMEKELGRELNVYEVVHHRDGNKRNNYPSNLIVCTQDDHKRIHRDNLLKYNSWHEPSFI